MTKSFNLLLAKTIRDGISKAQTILAKNAAKEQKGLAKLSKTIGQVPADQSGVGTDLGNGTAQEAVPMQMGEKRPGENHVEQAVARKFENPYASGSPVAKDIKAKKNNTRSEFEASKVEKGVLPEDGGNMAMSEMDGNDEASCPMCNGPLHILGSLGNTIHMVCRNCGAMHATTPHDENTEAKEGADIAVSKSEPLATMRTTKAKGISGLPAPKSKMVVKAERNWGKMTPAQKDASNKRTSKEDKAMYDADLKERSKNKPFKVAVNKAELKKEETSPIKEAPMTALVMPEKVTGAKVDDGKTLPKAINYDGSGEVTKGKSFNKGALVEHVKNAANKAGVSVKDVLGYKPPKTLQAVKPAATPNFNKGSLPMVPGQGVANKNKYMAFMSSLKHNPKTANINNTGAKTINTLVSPEPKLLHPSDGLSKAHIPMVGPGSSGVQKEIAVKTGRDSRTPIGPLATKLEHVTGGNRFRQGGGVQSQIAAQKKPLIPMVNSGVVAKAALEIAPSKTYDSEPFDPYQEKQKKEKIAARGKASAKRMEAEESKKKVTKAEPTMAKPVTKSPSSGPAGKAPAIKASPAVMKTPKL